ncbi:hypothetical protein ACFFMN_33970 [Planobispora siamensis]|uniref:Uncharacterized protein n=1 Tax=Planobispora siamensis TaxID=936338 RepID=A0A8J3WJR6_9ACTN|nr:hypothetical protein [Planobispora siamensis]GIH91938.1 hypothetical protein Psi01_25680 [Planobispora siamensis]
MPLSARALLQLSADLTSSGDLFSGTASTPFSRQISFSDGAGLNQANRIWSDERTLVASANEDLDLAGVLTDPFGATVTFARIKALIVAASLANANNVVVGGGASNPFINWASGTTPAVIVRPGGLLALFAPDATGYVVTGGTGDLLRVANSGAGTPVTYQIVLIGAAS